MDNSRVKKYVDEFQCEWKKKFGLKNRSVHELAEQIDKLTGKGIDYSKIYEIKEEFKKSGFQRPSEFFRNKYHKLVALFVPEEYFRRIMNSWQSFCPPF